MTNGNGSIEGGGDSQVAGTPSIEEEIKNLKLDIDRELDLERKYELSGRLVALTIKKHSKQSHLNVMHEKMHEAADKVEAAGYTGKGAKDD